MNHTKHVLYAALASVPITLATAHAGTPDGTDEASLSIWKQMTSLEPCMNGDVSASGLYSSQIAEDKSFATLGTLAELSSQKPR